MYFVSYKMLTFQTMYWVCVYLFECISIVVILKCIIIKAYQLDICLKLVGYFVAGFCLTVWCVERIWNSRNIRHVRRRVKTIPQYVTDVLNSNPQYLEYQRQIHWIFKTQDEINVIPHPSCNMVKRLVWSWLLELITLKISFLVPNWVF